MTPARMDVAVVGSVNMDLVVSVARLPVPGETVHATGHQQFVGGKGGNQAVAAARLGCSVAFVGLTGDDAEGAAVRSALAAEDVDLSHLGVTSTAGTGRAVVLVDDGAENSIVVIGGANADLAPADLETAAEVLAHSTVVVAQLEIPVETVLAAARRATGTFVLNAAPARELPRELLERVDVLVVNETEYEVVLGRTPPDDHALVAEQVAASGLRCTLVLTLGSRGALLCHDGVVAHVPSPSVPVVDTTGAGDAFIGALADALSRRETPAAAVRWAVHAASLSVGSLGATTGMPTRSRVLASVDAEAAPPVPLGNG